MAEEKTAIIKLTEEGFTGQMENKDFILNLSNTTFNATDLMLISIGYCFGITVDAYAKHKGLNISNLKINVKGKKHESENRYEKIDIEVSFDGDLTPEQRERVIVIGKRGCTVSNSMLKTPDINVILI
ncbi:OsmC family protein [Sulfurihydrogenibium sp.]|uniref:OsmC family protein n=1 Tax=Sulfurihydrogenibium sp. TaxID=2053621 RepID=UPI00262E5E97|nr:OsmC family protein [Sulfurihydrogenibium sp.]